MACRRNTVAETTNHRDDAQSAAHKASEVIFCPIRNCADVETAERFGRAVALAMGFSPPDAHKIALVISELGQHIQRYARRGAITVISCAGENSYIKIVAQDQGPGIPDAERAPAGNHSTAQGLGMSGARELMDEFRLQSVVGQGTMIEAVKLLHEDS
jgi:serine/threonine-protein kinase RsbT